MEILPYIIGSEFVCFGETGEYEFNVDLIVDLYPRESMLIVTNSIAEFMSLIQYEEDAEEQEEDK